MDNDSTINSGKDTIMDAVRGWVETTTGGWFRESDVYNTLHQSVFELKSGTIRQYLRRLAEDGTLEAHHSTNGRYRKIDTDATPIDWRNADPTDVVPIKLWFRLHEFIKIFHRNIIVIAGQPNVGKSSFVFDLMASNNDNEDVKALLPIQYFNSEMSPEEIKERAMAYPDVDWKFEAWDRIDKFADVVKPDKINIIDYLSLDDNFYDIGRQLKEIYKKLTTGICVVFIQKNLAQGGGKPQNLVGKQALTTFDLGVGGRFGLDIPRLYLSLSHGEDSKVLKVVKAKNWAKDVDPNNMTINYRMTKGKRVEEYNPDANIF